MRADPATHRTFAAQSQRPFYLATGNEETVFKAAYATQRALLLKGPTGCGKTRFVEAMAHDLGRPLITVACHDDLSAADLVGRFLLQGTETVWQDGPLTRAVRTGALCYLDEVIEARSDTLVVLHPLTDHRRMLSIERTGETLIAPPEFCLVMSFNPGYQSVLKELKPSTRQRLVAIEFEYPPPRQEREIIMTEAHVAGDLADKLIGLAVAIRAQDDIALREVASTRTLIAAAALIHEGVPPRDAVRAAMIAPLSDEREVETGLMEIAKAVFL